jgi:hypothetical protein
MGEIADRVSEFIPATYTALANASAYTYGPDAIQRTADTLKYRLFGTAVSASLEATVYDAFTLDYVAKLTTIKIIPAGADYWSDQLISETTPQENINYPNRIDSLWKIHTRLLTEVKEDQAAFEKLYPDRLRYSYLNTAAVNATEDDTMTLDPSDFGKAAANESFGNQSLTDIIAWTRWA